MVPGLCRQNNWASEIQAMKRSSGGWMRWPSSANPTASSGATAPKRRRSADARVGGERHSGGAQPEEAARLLLPPVESQRRGPGRAVHLHLHRQQRGSRPDQQLGAPKRCTRSSTSFSKGRCAGRTMYVIPYLMGPPGSPMAKVGLELTDSAYVVLNMRIMARMGDVAYQHLGPGRDFNRGHALDAGRESRPPLHLPFPARQRHHLGRLGLRRQRAAGQEMPGLAHRLLPGTERRLDGGAHADPGVESPQGKRPLSPRPFRAPAARPTSPC
jgi:hypothetical protein